MAISEKELDPSFGLELSLRHNFAEKESRKETIKGYAMLSIGAGGLATVVARLPLNLISLTVQDNPKDPASLNLQVVATALLCGLAIVACLVEAFLSFARARNVQDQFRRWLDLQRVPLNLDPQEYLTLIEDGPQRQETEPTGRRRQLWLFSQRSYLSGQKR